MKYKIVLLLILLTFCISNASALPYDGLPNPTELTNYPDNDTILFVGDDPDTDQKAIYKLFTDTGSWDMKVTGLPEIKAIDVVDNKIYFVTSSNVLYKCTEEHGMWNFSDSAYEDNFLNLGQFTANSITHTENNYHYGLSSSLYEKAPPVYTEVELTDTFSSWKTPFNLDVHKDGLLVCTGRKDHDRTVTGRVYLYDIATDSSTAVATISESHDEVVWAVFYGAVSDTSGNVYSFGATKKYHYSGADWPNYAKFYHHVYNSTTGEYSQEYISDVQQRPNDVTIADNVYASYGDTIESFATVDGISGYTGDPIPPTTGNVSWDKGEAGTYTAGDVATIDYNIENIDTSKDYRIEIATPSSTKAVHNLTDSSGSVSHSFSLSDLPATYAAFLYEDDEQLDSQHVYLENPDYDVSVEFSKRNYAVGEWAVIHYEGLTSDMEIMLLADQDTADPDVLETWTKSGDGQVSYKIPDDFPDEGMNVIVMMDGERLDNDYSDVLSGDDDVLYGTVYDSSTGQRISSASVTVNSEVSITSLDGNYQLTLPAGYYEATISESGYLDTTQWVEVDGSTEQNFYLTPESADSDVYGVVRDRDTNEPIKDVVIYITGNSYSETLVTSGSGYFSADGLSSGEEYDVSATVSGYESYESAFEATNNSTDLSFTMYPTGTGEDDPVDPDEPTVEDHREAAKNTLHESYGLVPSIFMLVLFFLVFQIISRGMK